MNHHPPVWDDDRLDLVWAERFGIWRGWALATLVVLLLIFTPLAVGGLLIEILGL